MESKSDKTLTAISRWACPWPAEVSNTHTNSRSTCEREPFSPRNSDRSNLKKELPGDFPRRLKTIGFAATGVAASVWLMAVIWVWQTVAA